MFSPNLAIAVFTMMLRNLVDTFLTAPPIPQTIPGIEVASALALSASLVYVFERLRKGQPLKVLFIPSTASMKSSLGRIRGTNSGFWVSARNSSETLMRTAEESLKALKAKSSTNFTWKTATSSRIDNKLSNECNEVSQFEDNLRRNDDWRLWNEDNYDKKRHKAFKKPVSKVTKRSMGSRTRSGKVYSVLVQ